MVAHCRLQKENKMLLDAKNDGVSCVEATGKQYAGVTIGPLFYYDLEVEGVPV